MAMGKEPRQLDPAPAAARPNRPTRSKVRSPISSSMRLLDIHDVVDFTRLSEKTIERLLERDEFPKPFNPSGEPGVKGSARRWTLASIEQWIRRISEAAA